MRILAAQWLLDVYGDRRLAGRSYVGHEKLRLVVCGREPCFQLKRTLWNIVAIALAGDARRLNLYGVFVVNHEAVPVGTAGRLCR